MADRAGDRRLSDDGDAATRPAKRRRIPIACGSCRTKKTRVEAPRLSLCKQLLMDQSSVMVLARPARTAKS